MKLKRKVVSSILAGSLVLSCGAVSFAKESIKENKVESIDTDSKIDSQSYNYGVIYDINNKSLTPSIDIITEDGTKIHNVDIDFDKDNFLGYENISDFGEENIIGDVIRYSINNDEEINHIEKIAKIENKKNIEITDVDFLNNYKVESGILTKNFDGNEIELDDKSFEIDFDVVIFDISDVDNQNYIDDLQIIDLESLEGKGEDAKVNIFYDENNEVKMMILNSDNLELEEHSGYITYAGAEEDYPVVEMDTLDEDYIVTKINGEESKREDYKKVQSRVVVYTQNSDGELQLYTTQQAYEDGNDYGDYEFITGQIVDERGGKSVEIEDISGKIKFIDIGSDTNIFEDCDKVEDVEIDDMVTILTDGRKALTVKIYDMDEDLDIDIAKENGLDESSFDIKDSANDLIDEADYILNRVEELKESKINLQKALETNNKEDIKDNIQELKEIIEEIK